MKFNYAFFLVEADPALALVKQHIADRQRVRGSVADLAKELGVSTGTTDRDSYHMVSVNFPGERHPDFTKPDRKGRSWPKKGTAWARRFAEQPRATPSSDLIRKAFDPVDSLRWTQGDSQGWHCIGNPFAPSTFLYTGPDGPYVMLVPDLPLAIKELEAEGKKVEIPDNVLAHPQGPAGHPAWNMIFPGCRRIDPEEWDILVAQEKLARRRSGDEVTDD